MLFDVQAFNVVDGQVGWRRISTLNESTFNSAWHNKLLYRKILVPKPSSANSGVRGWPFYFRLHQDVIDDETEREGNEPGISIQCVEEIRIRYLAAGCRRRTQKARDDWSNRKQQSDYGANVVAVRITIRPARVKKPSE